MRSNPPSQDELLAHVATLRKFALSLSGTMDRADDLVQETFLRAIVSYDSFRPGTNLAAWLTTILRNHFRDEYRKRQREIEDVDGIYAHRRKSEPEQIAQFQFAEFGVAFAKLPEEQRKALSLVAASGLSYDEAAAVCSCAPGTIKSRVSRGRSRLADLLNIDSVEDLGPDQATRGATVN
jgi:RNA polymerase sigma-70 factor, ECF subfamily